jgi:hypothetical protein
LFSLDRSVCELIGRTLLDALVSAEDEWKATSPAWKQRLRQFEAWEAHARQREQDAARARKAKGGGEDRPDAREAPALSWEATFDADDPLPEFSFAGISKYSRDELDDEVTELVRVMAPTRDHVD